MQNNKKNFFGLLDKKITSFLKEKEFINISTCDFSHNPNVAPKFFLKVQGDNIFLGDYILGRTWRNIRINSKVSLSTVNFETLIGYQLNGTAELLEKGEEFEKLSQEMHDRKVHFSVKRIIQAVQTETKSGQHEITFPDRIGIIKVKVQEVVEIAPSGKLARKKTEV